MRGELSLTSHQSLDVVQRQVQCHGALQRKQGGVAYIPSQTEAERILAVSDWRVPT